MPKKQTWWQQEQAKIERTREKTHRMHIEPTATAAPAAGTPNWLTELIDWLEKILGIIPILEGHTTEIALRKELEVKLARLKEGLPK